MLALTIFFVLVAGFFACHIHPEHSLKLHRYHGQYLYLKSAELGVKCCVLAFLMAVLLIEEEVLTSVGGNTDSGALAIVSAHLTIFFQKIGPSSPDEISKLIWFLLLSVLTICCAFIIKAWGHVSLLLRSGQWSPSKAKLYVMGELLSDSPMDDLLFRLSMEQDKYIMITTNDRKVYVGKVVSLGEPSETGGVDQDISIMPLMSGYRCSEDLRVKFTTDYDAVDEDICLALRQDTIMSATEFSFSAYQAWNSPGS